MSTDTFEDELRVLLRDSADAEGTAYVDVDPNVVVASGRRVVRRRRLAAGAGIAAAVLVIGAAGAVVGGIGQDRASSVPATQRATGPVSVDLGLGSALDGSSASVPSDTARVRFEVDESSLRWTATLVDGDVTVKFVDERTLPANPRVATYAEVGGDARLAVGVMPAAAKDIVATWFPEPVESTFASAPIPGTDRQVFALRHGGGSDTGLVGFDWFDGERVFTSAGTEVRSARFGDDVAFVDQGLFGIFTADGSATRLERDTPVGKLPAMMTGKVPDGSDTMESTVLVLLPAGARGVTVSPRTGATVRSVDTVPGGSTGPTMLLVRLAEPKASSGTGIEQVRWTGADGGAASGTLG